MFNSKKNITYFIFYYLDLFFIKYYYRNKMKNNYRYDNIEINIFQLWRLGAWHISSHPPFSRGCPDSIPIILKSPAYSHHHRNTCCVISFDQLQAKPRWLLPAKLFWLQPLFCRAKCWGGSLARSVIWLASWGDVLFLLALARARMLQATVVSEIPSIHVNRSKFFPPLSSSLLSCPSFPSSFLFSCLS